MILHVNQRRVLGVLIEKSIAQPEYYPMTLSAVLAACNQKNNRHPYLEMEESSVLESLNQLREMNLAMLVLPGPGARTNRYKHEVDNTLKWNRYQQAVIAELLLRGPQTVGELRTHCERMMTFENLEAVSAILDSLAHLTPPLVAALPRSPGQSAIRYTHLLYPQEESTELTFTESRSTTPSHSTETTPLLQQLQKLQDQIDDLNRRLTALESR